MVEPGFVGHTSEECDQMFRRQAKIKKPFNPSQADNLCPGHTHDRMYAALCLGTPVLRAHLAHRVHVALEREMEMIMDNASYENKAHYFQ